ncbi:MAG: DUF1275 domain-containing protein [Lactobacillales bacterium]|jgi:uncharacterized membrane protein YoaK (UPF0700 family)|nr:DUF1275 domain-containing protein [Lactobacillales bacterium]
MKNKKQTLIHEKLEIALLLTATGGFMDSYSYLTHGARFASLQSGNVILMAVHLIRGEFSQGCIYLFPIVAFTIGSGVSFLLKNFARKRRFPSHRFNLFIEFVGITCISLLVNFLPNNLFISILAFFAAIQADTFTKLRGMPYANIMTTGNIRTMGSMLIGGFLSKDSEMILKGRNAFFVVVSFFAGALISGLVVPLLGNFAILGASLVLMIVFLILQKERCFTLQGSVYK